MENFATRLKFLRMQKGLSQQELALELHCEISQPAIATWEANKRQPNLDACILLAKYFDVSLDYLAGLTNN